MRAGQHDWRAGVEYTEDQFKVQRSMSVVDSAALR